MTKSGNPPVINPNTNHDTGVIISYVEVKEDLILHLCSTISQTENICFKDFKEVICNVNSLRLSEVIIYVYLSYQISDIQGF